MYYSAYKRKQNEELCANGMIIYFPGITAVYEELIPKVTIPINDNDPVAYELILQKP